VAINAILGETMRYSEEEIAELNILIYYSLNTNNQGIKIHSNADPEKIVAVQRLFDKGFVTQIDGGYLTDLGREAAEHAQALILMLAPHERSIAMLGRSSSKEHENSFSTLE